MINSKDILEAHKRYLVDRIDSLKNELDVLNQVIPGSALFDHPNHSIVETYFEPETEKERVETINYIKEFLQKINDATNDIINRTYKQMESFLGKYIAENKLENKYKSYDDNIGTKKSILQKRLDFLINNKNFMLTDAQKETIAMINNPLRKIRNTITHELDIPFSFEEVTEFVGDVVNLDPKLMQVLNSHIDFVNSLFSITVYYFELCDKICS
jgi:hypothetical protein